MTEPTGRRFFQYTPFATELKDSDLLLAETGQEPPDTPILQGVEFSVFRQYILGATGLGSLNSANAEIETLTTDLVLTDDDFLFQVLDPGGANRTVTLPAESEALNHAFFIRNTADADELITVLDDASAVVGKVWRDETKIFMPTGTGWVQVNKRRATKSFTVGSMISETANGAASGTLEAATYKQKINTKDFDAATDEYVDLTFRMPVFWDGGTIRWQFQWGHGATTTNFGVSWNAQGRAYANDDAFDQAWGTAVEIEDTGGTTGDIYETGWTPAMTLAGTLAGGQLVTVRIYRDADGVAGNLAVDAKLISATMEYTRY